MSAKPRSLLKLDQAYIAVGGREHLTLERETDIMRTIALRISPRDTEVPIGTQSAYEIQRCRVAHDLPRLSPVGTNRDAHRIGSRFPLGPRSPSSITPDMYPHGMPNIPNGRETSPRIPFPPGRADWLRRLSVSSHVGSRPLNRWGPSRAHTSSCTYGEAHGQPGNGRSWRRRGRYAECTRSNAVAHASRHSVHLLFHVPAPNTCW